jgi:beta-lactamase superfamily II metal-dependent hydrolase
VPIADLASTLGPDSIHLVVFGPGFGESILVGGPNETWLVVDSLGVPKSDPTLVPAIEFLRTRGVRASAVVLTHPHDDHVIGLDRILASYTDGLVGVVDISRRSVEGYRADNGRQVLKLANRRKAMSAITGYWQSNPSSRWKLTVDDPQRQVGGLSIEVLHPDQAMIDAGLPDPIRSPNPWSAALVVSWRGTRLVLGADLPNDQWQTVLDRPREAQLSRHAALKVSHHGSRDAQHPALLGRSGGHTRHWVVTPWHLMGGILPRLDDGDGTDVLLAAESPVLLTAPGRRLTRRITEPVSRRDLSAAVEVRRLPAGLTMELEADADPEEGWAAFTFDGSGTLVGERAGRDALVVTR